MRAKITKDKYGLYLDMLLHETWSRFTVDKELLLEMKEVIQAWENYNDE